MANQIKNYTILEQTFDINYFIYNCINQKYCEFLYQEGEKLNEGNYEDIDINGKETREKYFEYFEPYKTGTISWTSLEIFAGHRQKMKYKKNSI